MLVPKLEYCVDCAIYSVHQGIQLSSNVSSPPQSVLTVALRAFCLLLQVSHPILFCAGHEKHYTLERFSGCKPATGDQGVCCTALAEVCKQSLQLLSPLSTLSPTAFRDLGIRLAVLRPERQSLIHRLEGDCAGCTDGVSCGKDKQCGATFSTITSTIVHHYSGILPSIEAAVYKAASGSLRWRPFKMALLVRSKSLD